LSTLLKILEVLKENLYIAPKEGYNDFIINEVAIKIIQQISLNNSQLNLHQQPYGWVYIAKLCNDDSIIKIGLTKLNKAEYRIEMMNSDHSYLERERIELFYTRLTSDCRKVEKQMHILFKESNIKGEWFKVNCEVTKNELDKMINELDTPHLN